MSAAGTATAASSAGTRSAGKPRRAPESQQNSGGAAVVLVSALSAAFGTVLIMIVADLAAYFDAMGLSEIGQLATVLGTVAALFFTIALFVGAVVTSNSVATVIAGRTKEIALLRLIGASGKSLRARTVREGLVQGASGALAGAVLGVGLTALGAQLAIMNGALEPFAFPIVHPAVLAPVIAVTAATITASWVGSRRVLSVSPIAATSSTAEPTMQELRAGRGRSITAVILIALGVAMLVGGVYLGLSSPTGVLVSVVGGMLSFVGVVIGSPVILPPLMSLAGRALGRGPVTRLAAANAVRNPARSSRAVIGLVIGITLVTMFAVATETFRTITLEFGQMEPEMYAAFEQVIDVTTAIMSVLLGFSVLLAAVGMVNTLSLSVMQRRRELGLLRALGFTAGQVRRMIVTEAVAMIASSALFGLLLGVFYGWVGAQATFGSMVGRLMMPSIPWVTVAAVLLVTLLITVAASLLPARRATRVSPVAALAVD
ncbi:putative ABC transport system permease protein [Pseudoclavibacter sp. JAI123]|uniref:ABC transporter permease n=1 Tax=Pseudoclavibacter sp. JAI123 TaxID=2723065 RepID=UPI0017B2274C|nr:FtsX-like permease family protein [Pseudoclavibacter sp. JAI123]NYF13940.1 putative ABC transport system permease protein [Pseudoclavibacter sp. JAI123]